MRKLVMLVVLLMFALPSYAQGPEPEIISFTASRTDVDIDDLEANTALTTVYWRVAGIRPTDTVELQAFAVDNFSTIANNIGATGTLRTNIYPTWNFDEPPTLRLAVIDASRTMVASRTNRFNYTTSALEPTIQRFSLMTVATVNREALQNQQTNIQVLWEVINRVPSSNLVFEQVLANGDTVNVEMPRAIEWVSSQGGGRIVPVVPEGNNAVIRLRVVDVFEDDVVYDEAFVTLQIIDGPTSTQVPPPTPQTPPNLPTPPYRVNIFQADPSTVNPGETVTISWDVEGTDRVRIFENYMGGPGFLAVPVDGFESLPSRGTAEYTVPDIPLNIVGLSLTTTENQVLRNTSIDIICPHDVVFDALVTTYEVNVCPPVPAQEVSIAYQRFERGSMLYLADSESIYVLYDNGTLGTYGVNTYRNFSDPTGEAPDGFVLPSSGFGRVWMDPFFGVRDALGFATTTESGYRAFVQRYSGRLYTTRPDGQLLWISPGDGWRAIR